MNTKSMFKDVLGTQFLPRTGQSRIYKQGDDATYKVGWPAIDKPRFNKIHADITYDLATGLRWINAPAVKIAGYHFWGKFTWDAAIDMANALALANYGDYSDWRIPNIVELSSIIKFNRDEAPYIDEEYFSKINNEWTNPGGEPEDDNKDKFYWSSTTFQSHSSVEAWMINFYRTTTLLNYRHKGDLGYVFIVRGGCINEEASSGNDH